VPLRIFVHQVADPALLLRLDRIAAALEALEGETVRDDYVSLIRDQTQILRGAQDKLQAAINEARGPATSKE
jgi:hypothetical protein